MEGMGCLLIPRVLCLLDSGGVLQAVLAALGRGWRQKGAGHSGHVVGRGLGACHDT